MRLDAPKLRGHLTQATKLDITLDTRVSKKESAGPTGLVPVFVPLPGFGFWRAGAGGGSPGWHKKQSRVRVCT